MEGGGLSIRTPQTNYFTHAPSLLSHLAFYGSIKRSLFIYIFVLTFYLDKTPKWKIQSTNMVAFSERLPSKVGRTKVGIQLYKHLPQIRLYGRLSLGPSGLLQLLSLDKLSDLENNPGAILLQESSPGKQTELLNSKYIKKKNTFPLLANKRK